MQPASVRIQAGVYGSGLFGATMSNVVAVVMPLWLLSLGAAPVMTGLALGAFNFLPFLFSVHGGALMDRFGARRVMIGAGAVGVVAPLLFPVLPYVWAVMVLQMAAGMTATLGWIGAQTLVGQLMHGSPRYAGRLAFTGVIGNLFGPPLIGAAWDTAGAWAAFAVMSLWAVCQLVSALLLPREVDAPARTAGAARLSLRDLVPDPGGYLAAFRLLSIPAVAFVVVVSMLRLSGNSIQGSFYVVYLNDAGISGTAIGVLMAASAIASATGALFADRLTRIFRSTRLQLVTSLVSVLAIAATPLLGLYVLLLVAQLVRGACVGISTPLIISDMSAAVGPAQGKAVGLRTMSNRFISTVTPVAMGGLVALAGLGPSLLVSGVVVAVLMAAVAVFARRRGVI